MLKMFAIYIVVVGASCGYSQENNSFAEQQVYSPNAFRFEIPRPWFYATPDSGQKKNVARCFLHSRLRMTAQGLLLVDQGRAAGAIEETINGMIRVMKHGNDAVEVSREDVVLDGDSAVQLKSSVTDYNVPCTVIVHDHKGTLYLIMMSISKKNDLENRDLMLQTLLKTWKWKELAAKKPKE